VTAAGPPGQPVDPSKKHQPWKLHPCQTWTGDSGQWELDGQRAGTGHCGQALDRASTPPWHFHTLPAQTPELGSSTSRPATCHHLPPPATTCDLGTPHSTLPPAGSLTFHYWLSFVLRTSTHSALLHHFHLFLNQLPATLYPTPPSLPPSSSLQQPWSCRASASHLLIDTALVSFRRQ